jgi:hypothetical protein
VRDDLADRREDVVHRRIIVRALGVAHLPLPETLGVSTWPALPQPIQREPASTAILLLTQLGDQLAGPSPAGTSAPSCVPTTFAFLQVSEYRRLHDLLAPLMLSATKQHTQTPQSGVAEGLMTLAGQS